MRVQDKKVDVSMLSDGIYILKVMLRSDESYLVKLVKKEWWRVSFSDQCSVISCLEYNSTDRVIGD